MALTLNVPEKNPKTGVTGVEVKPITDGEKITVVENQTSSSGFWSVLDDIGTTVANGVSSVASAIVKSEVDKIKTGAESTPDRTGDPYDQPGRVEAKANIPFYQTYKKELMIGGGVIAAVAVFFLVKK